MSYEVSLQIWHELYFQVMRQPCKFLKILAAFFGYSKHNGQAALGATVMNGQERANHTPSNAEATFFQSTRKDF